MAEDNDVKKEEKPEEKPSNGRWWEFYVVRYALGTVFGALIVNILAKSGLAIPFPEGSVSEITKPERLPLLIGYGLAYCYFASAPILVFHSARFSMRKTGLRKQSLVFTFLSGAAAAYWGWHAKELIHSSVLCVLATLVVGMVVLMTFSQFQALYNGMDRTEEMWFFYRNLDQKRRVKENNGLVESYRHLREHGNAFFVVFMEILLGFGIYVAGKVSIFPPQDLVSITCKPIEACDTLSATSLLQIIVLLLIWIVPGAIVWTIGCILEREFAFDNSLLPAATALIPNNVPVPPNKTKLDKFKKWWNS